MFSREHAGGELIPARVSRNSKQIYHILCEEGEFVARVSGNFRHNAKLPSDYPAVGDWVVVKVRPDDGEADIQALLPRRTVFSRQAVSAAGTEAQSREQIVATNIDVVLLVAALDGNRGFNLRRLERYLTLARNSGADPVVILNKIDLCDDPAPAIADTEAIAAGAPVHAISALDENAVEPLRELIREGSTVVLLGPSGIGKSTIINAIAGEEIMQTGEVRRSDKRGRHTTTWSELNIIARGGVLVDTPGAAGRATLDRPGSHRRDFRRDPRTRSAVQVPRLRSHQRARLRHPCGRRGGTARSKAPAELLQTETGSR